MQAQNVGDWLTDLASQAPAPGGGAAAAMDAAMGAALISMVCNLTIGKPKYAEHEQTMTQALAQAEELRRRAISLADADAKAFQTVMAAYGLPKETDADKQARTAAIQTALVGAAEAPLQTAEVAAEVITLGRTILDGANVNVISDVAVAASSARAALESAALNVEVNLAALKDPGQREELAARLAGYTVATGEAQSVIDEVRARITK